MDIITHNVYIQRIHVNNNNKQTNKQPHHGSITHITSFLVKSLAGKQNPIHVAQCQNTLTLMAFLTNFYKHEKSIYAHTGETSYELWVCLLNYKLNYIFDPSKMSSLLILNK